MVPSRRGVVRLRHRPPCGFAQEGPLAHPRLDRSSRNGPIARRRKAITFLGRRASSRTAATVTFGTFSLDEETGQLWQANAVRPLRAKSVAVLCELARRRGRLVTKEELFRTCWPATAVSQTVLRVCIREIRVALTVGVPASVALETVGRRGYRLVTAAETTELRPDPLVGRDRELRVLRHALVRADGGSRQVVFVGGERGIGK